MLPPLPRRRHIDVHSSPHVSDDTQTHVVYTGPVTSVNACARYKIGCADIPGLQKERNGNEGDKTPTGVRISKAVVDRQWRF